MVGSIVVVRVQRDASCARRLLTKLDARDRAQLGIVVYESTRSARDWAA
jgi:hypothetical protein